MVFGRGELEYDNCELLRGQSHVIKVTQRSKTAGNITISCNTTLWGFFLGDKFNGSIFFDIRWQHYVLKVTFKVILGKQECIRSIACSLQQSYSSRRSR